MPIFCLPQCPTDLGLDVDMEEATPSGSEPELVTATKRVSRMINVKTATLHDYSCRCELCDESCNTTKTLETTGQVSEP